jgi:hypothetical protein
LTESKGKGSHRNDVWISEEHVLLPHYVIVGHGSRGLELPHPCSDIGGEMLPVFSSEEAAREFLSLSSLGKEWCVREFSRGELVSLLFAYHKEMKGVLLDPKPGANSGDAMVSRVRWDAFVSSLVGTQSHRPAVGAPS